MILRWFYDYIITATNYKMTVDGFSGDTGNSLQSPKPAYYQSGMQFSTYDRDNDNWAENNCATMFGGGGFWYNNCWYTSPNAAYNTLIVWDVQPSGMECNNNHCQMGIVRLMIKELSSVTGGDQWSTLTQQNSEL